MGFECKSTLLADKDLAGFLLASLNGTTWLANFILKFTCRATLIDFFSEFLVKYVAAKKVLLNAKPRIPSNYPLM